MALGDQIMLLEDFGLGAHEISELDLLSALFDFPRQSSESLLSGANDAEDEIIKLSTVLERPPRPSGGRRPPRRPRPMPVIQPYPVSYGPSILPTVTEVIPAKDPEAIQRIRAIEQKMAKLHPDQVKLLRAGIEGFGENGTVGAAGDLKLQTQIGAMRVAAANPSSDMAKMVVSKLGQKAAQLDKLAKDRLNVAKQAVQSYQKDKATVDRLERVAKAKALKAVETAISGNTDASTAREMDSLLTEVRRLNSRAVGVGRRAVQNMKLYGAATLLSKNADGQAMLTRATKNAISSGNEEAAKVLSTGLGKHVQTAKNLKAVRTKQKELWAYQGKNDVLNRLSGRRERYLKAIELLQKKAQTSGLSEEDQRAMKDAYAKLFRNESAALSVTGGTVMPAAITNKLEGLGQESAYATPTIPSPYFSQEVEPNDPSGAFLTGLEAIREARFSVEDRDQMVNPTIWARDDIPCNPQSLVGLEAIREAKFSVEDRDQSVNPTIWYRDDFPGEVEIQLQGLGAIREAKFSVQGDQSVNPTIWARDDLPYGAQGYFFPPSQIRGLDRIVLGWFGDAGDTEADTPKSAPYEFINKPAEIKAIGKAVKTAFSKTARLASGETNAVKLVSATNWKTLQNIPKESLKAAAQALKKGSKGVAGEVYRQAQAVHKYVKSPRNSVCGMISAGGVEMIGAASSEIAPTAASMKYLNKVCGKVGGSARAMHIGNVENQELVEAVKQRAEASKEKIVGQPPSDQYYNFGDLGVDVMTTKLFRQLQRYRGWTPEKQKKFRDSHPVTYQQMMRVAKALKVKKERLVERAKTKRFSGLGQAPSDWKTRMPVWVRTDQLRGLEAGAVKFPNTPEAIYVRKVKSKTPSFPQLPQAMWVRSKQIAGRKGYRKQLGEVSFPKTPKAMWLRSNQIPGRKGYRKQLGEVSFPKLPQALWVRKSQLEGGVNFPDLPKAIWITVPKMSLVEGAALAAPLLIT
jgi:hypothetical protein